jgi:hypothetical protein
MGEHKATAANRANARDYAKSQLDAVLPHPIPSALGAR